MKIKSRLTHNNSTTKPKFGILAISVIVVLAISTSSVIQYVYATDAPIIIALVAADPDNLDDVYSVGDTITITFDSDTNESGGTGMQTGTVVDELFTFTESLGDQYRGQWTTPDTFTITIKNTNNAGPPVIDVTTVTPSGTTPILSADGTSDASFDISPVLSGDFGKVISFVAVPIGTVLDWWCSADCTIPDRFVLADGSIVNDSESQFNGETLPDLRDMFVRGVSVVGNVGEIGGTTSHNHIASVSTEIVLAGDHTHTVNPSSVTSTSATHSHKWSHIDSGADWNSYNSGGSVMAVSDSTNGSDESGYGIFSFAIHSSDPLNVYYYTDKDSHSHDVDIASTTSSLTGQHSHDVDIASTTSSLTGQHSHDASSSASVETTNHEPPYVVLVKIIRIK